MPSIQKRKVSVAEELATIEARLTKLETFPPSGMQVLVSASGLSGNSALTSATNPWSIVSNTSTASFTLLRSVPLFIIATANVQNLATGQGSLLARVGLSNGLLTGTVVDWYVSNALNPGGAAPLDNIVTTGISIMVATVPAGTYTAAWYAWQAAGTGSLTSAAITVFQLPG